MPPAQRIVIGQRVDETKVRLAQKFREAPTPEEKKLWEQLRRNRLEGFHFRQQQPIDGFIVDFYCHAVGVVVEIDGPFHENSKNYDAARDQVLQARNLLVLRVTNEEVNDHLPDVLSRIARACQARRNG